MNFDGFSVMFLLLGAITLTVMLMQVTPRGATLASPRRVMLMQVTPRGATLASPRRVMRHINKRRRFMGQPELFSGDPVLPDDWECNATREQEWRGKQ